MPKIRVFLAEDHTIVRKGIRSLLNGQPDIEVVGEAANGRDAVEQVETLQPDIVLMDITMPELNGLEATRRIKKEHPHIKVLVLTMYTNEEYIHQLLQAGASGYLDKHTAPNELVLAIQSVNRGDPFLSPSISKTIIEEYLRQSDDTHPEDNYDKLSSREREVLQLLAEGHSYKDVAEKLQISVKTVGVHRINIMEKLTISNSAELVKYAIRKGIISLD
jgi:two-component system response regulator NreC